MKQKKVCMQNAFERNIQGCNQQLQLQQRPCPWVHHTFPIECDLK